jgi:hypothetical protein
MNSFLNLWLVLTAVIAPSILRAQDEKSLAYYVIRLDATSVRYLNKAKSLLDEVKRFKEAKISPSPDTIANYDPDSQDYSARELGEDGGSGGEAEWRIEETYVAALSAKRALVNLLEFLVQHTDIADKERTPSMNMLVQNSLLRLKKADGLMKSQAEQVKAEMESCSDKIGAVPRWEGNNPKFQAALTKLNDLIAELSKLTQ